MSIAATVGVPIVTGIPTCIHDGFVAIERLRGVNQTYLLYVLKSLEGELRLAGQTGSQANVNTEIVNGLLINLPPEPEQKRIAEVLRDTDDQIATLKRLITKRLAIKQGMMQHLITGRTRLPGFSEPWSEQLLGEVALLDPETLRATTTPREFIDYISLEDVSDGVISGFSRMSFGSAPSRARRVIRKMDVLFGTVRPNLRSHAIYTGGFKCPIASTGFAIVRALNGCSDARFLFYLLMSRIASIQIERIIAGSSYPAVSSGDVRRLVFNFPGIEEQCAISSALEGCDDELVKLNRYLAKANAVKRGMMQELLTGRARLPVKDGAA